MPPRVAVAVLCLALGACSSDESRDGTGGTSSGGKSSGGSSSGGGSNGGSSSGGSSSGGASSGGSSSAYDCTMPHPAWLLCDDFEGMANGFDGWLAASPWTENIGAANPGRMTSSTEAHGGSFALYMPAEASAGYQ